MCLNVERCFEFKICDVLMLLFMKFRIVLLSLKLLIRDVKFDFFFNFIKFSFGWCGLG